MNRPSYGAEEAREIRRSWSASGTAACPRCRRPLVARPIPNPTEVSYVRRRSWLTCPECRRALVADDPREAP